MADEKDIENISGLEQRLDELGKIDEDIDLFNLSIFSDLDIEGIQDDRNREVAFRSKLKRLRKKYFEKIDKIHALDDHLLLTKEFTDLKDNAFLPDIHTKVDQLPINYNTDLNKNEEKIYQNLKEENQVFLYERNKKMIDNLSQAQNRNHRILKPRSCYRKFRQAILAFLYFFVPFNKDFIYLNTKGDSALIILFQVLRLMLIISTISIIIFAYLIINHFLTNKELLKAVCKYNIPCIMLYSYHSIAERETYSITIGVWIVFIFFCGIIYFFLTLSEYQAKQLFIRKESLVSQYIFSSWNFNTNSRQSSINNKNDIVTKCKDYIAEENQRLKIKTNQSCCSSSCFGRFMMSVLSWFILIVLMFILTLVLLVVFLVRSAIKDKAVNKQAIVIMDIIPEVLLYILVPIILIFFPFVSSYLPRMEMFSSSAVMNKHVIIKYFITHCWGIISLIGIQSIFTIKNKSISDVLGGISLGGFGFGTFGCSGIYTINENITEQSNYSPLPVNAYSHCSEDDAGINFLFFAVGYFIVYIIKDFIVWSCIKCCCKKIVYQPYESLIAVFSMIILFSITAFFIPIFIALVPIVVVIMFQFELFKLKKLNKDGFISYNSINQRNKSIEMLFAFVLCLLWLIGSCLYFYLSRFPHLNFSICMSNATINVMFYSDTMQCGPIPSLEKFSEALTYKIFSTPFIGDLYRFFSEPSLIIIALSSLISAFVYWRFREGEYKNFNMKRQKEMMSSLHLTIDHLVKRDVITSALLKMSRKKTR